MAPTCTPTYEYAPITWVDPFGLEQLSYDEVVRLIGANNKSGQSTELVLCLIYKESTFFTDQVNPNSTAVGLVGIEQGAATDLDVPYENLTDAATNIPTGTQYLHRRIDWKRPFGAAGNVRDGLIKYGTGQASYADSILKCEECLKKEAKKDAACKTKDSLEPLHPKPKKKNRK